MIGSGESILKAAQRFCKDRRGVSALEFALIAPVMIAAYCGMSEECRRR